MESADDSQKLKITQEDFRQAETSGYCPQTHQINPMTLFAYSGDQQTDKFAHAFSAGAQAPTQQTFATESLLKQGARDQRLARLEKSAQSNSSDGSSLTKEIFNSVLPLSFEEQLKSDNQALPLREERSCSNSTLESSELNSMQMGNFNVLYQALSTEDQGILCNLNFNCFDQLGCRMLQQKICAGNDEKFGVQSNPFYNCLVQ